MRDVDWQTGVMVPMFKKISDQGEAMQMDQLFLMRFILPVQYTMPHRSEVEGYLHYVNLCSPQPNLDKQKWIDGNYLCTSAGPEWE